MSNSNNDGVFYNEYDFEEENRNDNPFEERYNSGVYYTIDPNSVKWHVESKLIPQANKHAYDQLKKSIARKGQLIPVKMLDGFILDGRIRAQVCSELGYGLLAEDLPSDTNPRQYLASINLERKHLTFSQKAATAVLMVEMMGNRPIEQKVAYASKVADVSAAKIYKCLKIRELSENAFWDIHSGFLIMDKAERQFGLK